MQLCVHGKVSQDTYICTHERIYVRSSQKEMQIILHAIGQFSFLEYYLTLDFSIN